MLFNNKYDIKDKVFHITPESLPGVVLDWKFYRSTGEYHYLVSTGFGQDFWCVEHEISTEKTF